MPRRKGWTTVAMRDDTKARLDEVLRLLIQAGHCDHLPGDKDDYYNLLLGYVERKLAEDAEG